MPTLDTDDTIAAIASATGGSLRGIIRISGPDCVDCLVRCFVFQQDDEFADWRRTGVVAATLMLEHNLVLPGMLLVWPTQRSYTRQPAAEFHTFGSPPLLNLAIKKICNHGSARLASPGEFTLRAFLSGRLDLTQAEAVLGVIDARADAELSGSLQQLAGGLSGPLIAAREQLMFVLAELEAGLDFVEEDIEFISRNELTKRLSEVQQTLDSITSQIKSRELTADNFRVALIGRPNAGKSSLFNALLGSNAAIVTPISGTTTDYLCGKMELSGVVLELLDTAGVDVATDSESDSDTDSEVDSSDRTNEPQSIANLAQEQTRFAHAHSDLQLLCIDGSQGLSAWDQRQLETLNETTIVVLTKSDLVAHPFPIFNPPELAQLKTKHQFVATSSNDQSGLEQLRHTILHHAVSWVGSEGNLVGATLVRTADSLRAATESVKLAHQAAAADAGEEIVAAELRSALDQLGLVVGTVYTDDILDVVFSRFCIGK